MAFRYEIRADLKLACFKFLDRVSIAEARQAFESYVADPGFDPSHAMLSDARAVTAIDASFVGILSNVHSLGRQLRAFDAGGVSVVLVDGETTFGMVRMLEQILDFTSKIKMRIATTEAEALALVGVRDADFSRLFAF